MNSICSNVGFLLWHVEMGWDCRMNKAAGSVTVFDRAGGNQKCTNAKVIETRYFEKMIANSNYLDRSLVNFTIGKSIAGLIFGATVPQKRELSEDLWIRKLGPSKNTGQRAKSSY